MDVLLLTYPEYCTSVITWALAESDSLSLGSKIDVISCTIRGIYALSGIHPHNKEKESISAQDENHATIHTNNDTKTTVFRPAMLAASKRKVIYTQNKLIPHAIVLSKAIMVALKTYIQNISLPSPTITLSKTTSSREIEQGDGIDTLLPSQCLVALTVIVNCTVNYPVQNIITNEVFQIANFLKDSTSLAIRRTCLAALNTCLIGLLDKRNTSNVARKDTSPLASLTNITTSVNRVGGQAVVSSEVMIQITTLVEWCMSTYTIEADADCRALKGEVIRLVVDAFGENNDV